MLGTSQFPPYIEYVIKWLTQIRSEVMTEIVSCYKSIFLTIPTAVGVSYLTMAFVTYTTKVLVFISYGILPFAVLAVGIWLTFVMKSTYFGDNIQYDIFGYLNFSYYILGTLLLIATILFIIIGVGLVVNYFVSLGDKSRIANCITIC